MSWRFRCLFTINEAESLTFDIAIPGQPAESEQEVMFTPHLEGGPPQTPEFIDKLDFLSSQFTFKRSQMLMLTKALFNLLSAPDEDEEDDEDVESMVVEA